jgi:hypothetical protein
MGKRLFEQGGDVTPSLDMRLASGKTGTPTVNHTWQTVVSWLEAGLNFLKKSENLNDLPNKTTALTNLGVYSSSWVDTLLLDKADADNVLALDNTTPFTPTTAYNPATKNYVDTLGSLSFQVFNSNGASTTSATIIARQKASIVTVHGQFETNGADGSMITPLLISSITNAAISPPVGIHYVAIVGSGTDEESSVRGYISANGNDLALYVTSPTKNTQIYVFSATYIV